MRALLGSLWLVASVGASVRVGGRPAILAPRHLLHLRGGGLDINAMLEATKDPEALAELNELMTDPEKMAEVRELMDEPEFRAQIMEAIASGGGDDRLGELQAALAGQASGLEDGLSRLGPSLGGALYLLSRATKAEEFEAACAALASIARRRRAALTDGSPSPRLRVTNEKLHEALLRHADGGRCLDALGFSEESTGEDGQVYLEVPPTCDLDAPQLSRALGVIDDALANSAAATQMSEAHGLPYAPHSPAQPGTAPHSPAQPGTAPAARAAA
jgi:hypothetical protein